MTASQDQHWLPTSQAPSMQCTLWAHSEKLGRLAGEISSLRQEVHLILRHLLELRTHPGPPSSSASPPRSPTPGTQSSTPKAGLGKLAKALGERAARLIRIAGLIKGAWGFWTVIAPSLLWLATASWHLISPGLRWLWQLAVGF